MRLISQKLPVANYESLAAWGIWALLSAAAICFVAIFSLPFPFGDEWAWVGQATGNEPVTLSWFWSPHNEHRMFVPRLIYLGLGAITGFDFRAGALFNVLILSGLAFAMMMAARAIRGKTSLYDAFFPLLLLHWAQAENLIWGFQLNFVTSVVLEGIILIAILRCGDRISPKSSALVMLCLVLLGLCGTYGLVFLPPMACWLFYASICKWQKGGPKAGRDAILMVFCAAIPAALAAFSLYGLNAAPSNQGLFSCLRTGTQFVCFGIGPVAKEIWPISGLLFIIVCAIIVRLCFIAFRRRPAERVRAVGLLMFFAGIIALASAIGMGRAYIGPMAGFEVRYMTLAAPVLLLFFFLCELYGGAIIKRHFPIALFLVMCVCFAVNAQKGISYSINLWDRLAKFHQDMRNDVPPVALGLRYADQWGYGQQEVFTTRLNWLRNARLGPYRFFTPRSEESIQVQSTCPQDSPLKIEPFQLAPGKSYTQLFSAETEGEIRRIDVRLDIGRRGRSLKYFDWALFKISGDGKKILLAKDLILPQSVCGDDYVSIPLNNIRVCKAERFALVLGVPDDAPETACIIIPLYRVVENADTYEALKAYLYLQSEHTSTPRIAARPEPEK